MLAGQTYAQVRKAMFNNDSVENTDTSDLRKALRKYGVRSARRLIPLRTRCYRELTHDAILKVNVKRNGNWHWIVWDAARQRPLDPQTPKPRPRAVSFLRVWVP
jgi:hypothetical protein